MMENEKPSANWRPREADGVVPVQTQRPENQRSQWCKSQSETKDLRTRSTDVQEQEKLEVPVQAERENLPFLHLFVLFKPFSYWMMPTCTGEEDLLYSVHQFKC